MDVLSMIVGAALGLVAGVWWQQRARIVGYRLALDHVEEMTRPGRLTTYHLDEALRKLRHETRGCLPRESVRQSSTRPWKSRDPASAAPSAGRRTTTGRGSTFN